MTNAQSSVVSSSYGSTDEHVVYDLSKCEQMLKCCNEACSTNEYSTFIARASLHVQMSRIHMPSSLGSVKPAQSLAIEAALLDKYLYKLRAHLAQPEGTGKC